MTRGLRAASDGSTMLLAMKQANGNQTHAARLLDISRDALRYKLKKFGLMQAEESDVVL